MTCFEFIEEARRNLVIYTFLILTFYSVWNFYVIQFCVITYFPIFFMSRLNFTAFSVPNSPIEMTLTYIYQNY